MGMPNEEMAAGRSVERLGLDERVVAALRAAGLTTSTRIAEYMQSGNLTDLPGVAATGAAATEAAVKALPADACEPVNWREQVVEEMAAGGRARQVLERWQISSSTLNALLDEAGRPEQRGRGR